MTIALAIFKWFFTPLGRLVAIVVAVSLAMGVVYVKIRSDVRKTDTIKTQKEVIKTIDKAKKARDAAAAKSATGGLRNDDGFRRKD